MRNKFLVYTLLVSTLAMRAMQENSANGKKDDIYVKGLEPGSFKDYPNYGVIDLEKQRKFAKKEASEKGIHNYAVFYAFEKEEFYGSYNMRDETPYRQKDTKSEEKSDKHSEQE